MGKNHLNPHPRFHFHRSGCRLSWDTLSFRSDVTTQLPLTLHPEEKTGEWTGTGQEPQTHVNKGS